MSDVAAKIIAEDERLRAEVERLRAPDAQFPCESCGAMTVSVTSEEIVCGKCYEASIRRQTFLDAAKMAEERSRLPGKGRAHLWNFAQELRRRAAEGVKDV